MQRDPYLAVVIVEYAFEGPKIFFDLHEQLVVSYWFG